jgi:hypothetical protein
LFSTRPVRLYAILATLLGTGAFILQSVNVPVPRGAPESSPPVVTTRSDASADLERRVADLEGQEGGSDSSRVHGEIAEVRAQIAELQGALSRVDVPPATETTSEEERARIQEQLTRDSFVLFEQTLSVEARDQGWSRAAEQTIVGAFEEIGQSGRMILESVRCRSTLCSVQIRSQSPNDFREIDVMTPLADRFSSGVLSSDGTTARMFLSREGAQLPRLSR